jgi:ATP-dependent RNA helicase RhlB
MQIEQDAEGVFALTGMTTMAVFGGIDYDKQARQLKDGIDVIFATPGRLMDYVRKKLVQLDQIQVFVCDEADRMFDMGFIEDVEFFLERIPEVTQKLLFSATTNDQVKELAFEYLETPEYISVNPEIITPENIEQHGIHCHATEKLRVMIGMLREHNPACSIIFTNTKLTAEWLYHKLVGNGIAVDLMTGDLPQKKRIQLIKTIKEGQLKALIATDVASRGLHISGVTHVYNFDLPDEPANYVHRIGRTARAGAHGYAYSLVCDDYGQNLSEIKDLLGNQASFTTEWPNEAYLTIEDKAGNPFEDRYKAREARGGYGASRDDGRGPGRDGGGGGRPDRGPRGEGGGGRGDRPDRGPRQGGDRPDRGPRQGSGGRPEQDRNRQQAQGGSGGPRQQHAGGQQGQGQGEGGKRKRRRRGRGGQGGEQGQQNGQRQGASGSRGPKSLHGRDLAGGAPRGFFGMIKQLFKTLFGLGK